MASNIKSDYNIKSNKNNNRKMVYHTNKVKMLALSSLCCVAKKKKNIMKISRLSFFPLYILQYFSCLFVILLIFLKNSTAEIISNILNNLTSLYQYCCVCLGNGVYFNLFFFNNFFHFLFFFIKQKKKNKNMLMYE